MDLRKRSARRWLGGHSQRRQRRWQVYRYPKAAEGRVLAAEALRPKDYGALNNPKTRESKEVLRRRAVRLAQGVKKLEAALKKLLVMEEIVGAAIPPYIDKAGAMFEAKLALADEPYWDDS